MKIHCEKGQFWGGLGDTITLAWIAEGSKGSADPIELVLKPDGSAAKRQIVQMLDVPFTEDDRGALIPSEAYNDELADGGKKPRLEYLRQRLGIECCWARPTLHVSDQARLWAAKERGLRRRKKLVLLFPQTCWKTREWPAASFLALKQMLESAGHAVMLMTSGDDERYRRHKPVSGQSLDKVAALMQAADLVIGNDSMPAHLACTVGAKTLAIMGPTKPECVFGHAPEVEAIYSPVLPCVGCHFKFGAGKLFTAACDAGCRSLMCLTSEEVFEKARSMLK